jgi:hypothetical protein
LPLASKRHFYALVAGFGNVALDFGTFIDYNSKMITSSSAYSKTDDDSCEIKEYNNGPAWLSETPLPPTIRSKRFSEAGSLIWSRRIFEDQQYD